VAPVPMSIHPYRNADTPCVNYAMGLRSSQQAQGGPVGGCSVTSTHPNGAWSAIQHAESDAHCRRRTNDEEKRDRRRGWCRCGGNAPGGTLGARRWRVTR
jgi:hypothetical protein